MSSFTCYARWERIKWFFYYGVRATAKVFRESFMKAQKYLVVVPAVLLKYLSYKVIIIKIKPTFVHQQF